MYHHPLLQFSLQVGAVVGHLEPMQEPKLDHQAVQVEVERLQVLQEGLLEPTLLHKCRASHVALLIRPFVMLEVQQLVGRMMLEEVAGQVWLVLLVQHQGAAGVVEMVFSMQ